MSEHAILFENVSKSFQLGKGQSLFEKLKDSEKNKKNQKFWALDNASFKVSKGETLAIIGRNGSGKTTLMRIIAGIYKPDLGTVDVQGNIAPLLHIGTGFHQELTAKSNIIMYGMLLGLSKPEITSRVDSIIKFADLEKFSNMPLKHYSSGMRLRLAFATALQIDPDIILLDEALAVGDRIFREKSYEAFQSFKKMGKTIVYTTHSLKQVEQFSDRVMLLHQGKKVTIGDPKETVEQYEQILNKKRKNNKN